MKVSDVISAIEAVAPLSLQDDFDNSGLQAGFRNAPVSKVLTCLDLTEDTLREAERLGCQMIVSHHPLLFHPLREVSDSTYQQRIVVRALASGIAVYSAHTSLDNAPGGVNYRIADMLGLNGLEWLEPRPAGGSGVIGTLGVPVKDSAFAEAVRKLFDVECLQCTAPAGRMIHRVAVCGGAGAFLMKNAMALGADCFITGELHYHDYFESKGMMLVALGHYQSEKCTAALLKDIITGALPECEVFVSQINTNPIRYVSPQV